MFPYLLFCFPHGLCHIFRLFEWLFLCSWCNVSNEIRTEGKHDFVCCFSPLNQKWLLVFVLRERGWTSSETMLKFTWMSFFSLQLRKVERDKKTMDQEIVELTNKLVDAKNTIDKLEELNVRAMSELCVCLCWRHVLDSSYQSCSVTGIDNYWSWKLKEDLCWDFTEVYCQIPEMMSGFWSFTGEHGKVS